MTIVFTLLAVQIALGAFDNLWHHEITERLPARRAARGELALHATREALYGVLFLGLAWYEWHGAWAVAVAALFFAELVVTVVDFLVEDRTRRLPPLERALHTVLAVNVGALLAVLAPVLAAWYVLPATVVATDHGVWSWLLTASGAGVLAWSVRNLLAVARLSGPARWQRDPLRVGRRARPRTVLVTGATGLIGRHLVRALVAAGERAIVLTRSHERARECFGPHVRIVESLDAIDAAERVHALVNLAGAPIADWPWTRRRCRLLLASRLDTTRAVVRLAARLHEPPEVLVSASAVGYYGVREEEVLTEAAGAGAGFQSRLCAIWERSARRAARRGVRVVTLRTGLVLDAEGGILPRLTASMRARIGVVLGDGRQWQPWIHARDLTRLIVRVLDDGTLAGPVNAVAPGAARHGELVSAAAHARRCLGVARVPGWPLRRALGELSELLVDGQLVIPAAALGAGFEFDFPRIELAMRDLLDGDRGGSRAGPVEVFYNGDCPVCSAEIAHYRRLAERERAPLILTDVSREVGVLAEYGLRREDLRRRLHVRDARGRVRVGVEAFAVLWGALGHYRWLARALGWGPVAAVADVLYEGVAARALTRYNLRRERAEPTR